MTPAVRLGTQGSTSRTTSAEIKQAGNIRTDMFRAVDARRTSSSRTFRFTTRTCYYELGIRHALRTAPRFSSAPAADDSTRSTSRPTGTCSVRQDQSGGDGRGGPLLVRCARRWPRYAPSSPVFLLVPALRPHDPESAGAGAGPLRRGRALGAVRTAIRSRLWLFAEGVASLDWATQGWRPSGARRLRFSTSPAPTSRGSR